MWCTDRSYNHGWQKYAESCRQASAARTHGQRWSKIHVGCQDGDCICFAFRMHNNPISRGMDTDTAGHGRKFNVVGENGLNPQHGFHGRKCEWLYLYRLIFCKIRVQPCKCFGMIVHDDVPVLSQPEVQIHLPTPHHLYIQQHEFHADEDAQVICNVTAAVFVPTFTCWLPLGTLVAYQFVEPPFTATSFPPVALANTPAVVTDEPQVSVPVVPLDRAHLPLLDVSVKVLLSEPTGAAVNVAQVPDVYQVPPEMIQPVDLEEIVTCSVPFPEMGVPGDEVDVGADPVDVGVPLVFGRYLIPVAGQLDFEPST